MSYVTNMMIKFMEDHKNNASCNSQKFNCYYIQSQLTNFYNN